MAATEYGAISVTEGNDRSIRTQLPWSAQLQVSNGTVTQAAQQAETSLHLYQKRTADNVLYWRKNPAELGEGCVAETPFGDVYVRYSSNSATTESAYTVFFWGKESNIWATTIQEAQELACHAYLYMIQTEAEKLGLAVRQGLPAEPQ